MQFSRDLAHALSPALWAAECLGFKPDGTQMQILDSPAKRLIVNCHRQWGKSTISSILCLHRAIFMSSSLCLIVAPALRQSQENFRKVLDFLDRLEQRPDLIEDTTLSLTMSNKSRILCLPGGSEGKTVRGFSAPDIVIEDESARCSDELFHALSPMLASNPQGRLILCSTPYGQRGHFYKIFTEQDGWLKVTARADENDRISRSFLLQERQSMPDMAFRSEYLCEFTSTEGALFDYNLIESMFDPSISPLFSGSHQKAAESPLDLMDSSIKPLALIEGKEAIKL